MFEVSTKFPNIRLDMSVVCRETAQLADDLARLMTGKVQIALLQHRKFVSGDTLKSIGWRVAQNSATFQHRQVIGGAGYKFIVSGRKAGSKMPIQQSGTGPRGGRLFSPLPLMLRWFQMRGIPQSAWWPILRSISRRGIKPTDIPATATHNALSDIRKYGIIAGQRIARGIVRVN